jgi:hypothetical protein
LPSDFRHQPRISAQNRWWNMTSTESGVSVPDTLLAGYIAEGDMARARGVVPRTLRAERQRGDGPPYVTLDRRIYYPESGFREWLKAIEKRPVRARRVA